MNALAEHSGLPYAGVSLCIAVMELVFGLTQPISGLIASRKTNRFVLQTGEKLNRLGQNQLPSIDMPTSMPYI